MWFTFKCHQRVKMQDLMTNLAANRRIINQIDERIRAYKS